MIRVKDYHEAINISVEKIEEYIIKDDIKTASDWATVLNALVTYKRLVQYAR